MRSLLIIALCFITFTGVSKGRPGKDKLNVISGQIIDAQTKEGLAGVKVFVEGTSTFTFTDFDGNFTFHGIGSQKIKISTEFVSYYTSQKELEVGKKKKTAIKDPIPVYPIM